jgi:hypothetical protein
MAKMANRAWTPAALASATVTTSVLGCITHSVPFAYAKRANSGSE